MDGCGFLDVASTQSVTRRDSKRIAKDDIVDTIVAIGVSDGDGVPDAASMHSAFRTMSVRRYGGVASNGVQELRSGIYIIGTLRTRAELLDIDTTQPSRREPNSTVV